MAALDLHEIVPEPPADLLDLSVLEDRVRRRRIARTRTAVGATALAAAMVVAAAVAIGSASPNHRPATAPGHKDGLIVFTRYSPGPKETFPLASLYAVSAEGGQATRITHQAGGIADVAAAPNGRKLAYVQETYHGRDYIENERVRIVNPDGSDDHAVYTCEHSSCQQLEWSPDSSRLLIEDQSAHMLEPDGTVQPICIGGCPGRSFTQASWSPDSTQLAVQAQLEVHLIEGGTAYVDQLTTMNRDGSGSRSVTDQRCLTHITTCTDDTGPVWSPDGSAIAFTRFVPRVLIPIEPSQPPMPRTPTEVMVTRPNGFGPREVASCADHCELQGPLTWSPAGNQLAYLTDRSNPQSVRVVTELYVTDLQSGLTSHGQLRASVAQPATTDVVWSPTGDGLAIGEGPDADVTPAPPAAGTNWRTYVIADNRGALGAPRLVGNDEGAPIAWLAAR